MANSPGDANSGPDPDQDPKANLCANDAHKKLVDMLDQKTKELRQVTEENERLKREKQGLIT
jgi:hypothetical protein